MVETPTAAEVARTIADAIDPHFPYAIGGAVALGFYAPPWATIDVDVNVFLNVEEKIPQLLDVLEGIDFVADESREEVEGRARDEGQFRGVIRGLRIDVFVPSVPYYEEIESRRRNAQLLGRPIWIVGPEDLVILKLMFFRRKDLADVEAILRDQGNAVDRDFVRQRLVELVGADDERLRALKDIERDVFGPIG